MFQLTSRGVRRGFLPACAAAALALGLPLGCMAAVQAQIDRSTLTLGEPFALTIESDDMRSGVQPDLAPLRRDFALLGTETASNTSIVNGTRTDRMRWIVQLQPLHAGRVEIPAIVVGNDRTAPMDVTVGAASAATRGEMAQHAFIEATTMPAGKSLYVQQQVPYTVRLFVDGDVQAGSLNPPDAGPDAVVEQLGKEKRYTASRHGRDYTVIERQYAISPEKSGPLKVSPASFQGTVSVLVAPGAPGADEGDPASDMMARMLRNTPFANDPMFRSGLMARLAGASTTRTLTAQGPGLAIDVRARPAAAKLPWLPAEQVTLHDSWADSPPQFKVGEPVTRTLTIKTQGLAGSQIPTLAPTAPANARVYPEATDQHSRIDGASIDGESRQTLTYIPSAEGTMDIPPLELAWWDTTAEVARSVSLPARQFTVAAGAAGAGAQTPPPQAVPAAAQPSATAPGVNRVGSVWQRLKVALDAVPVDGRWLAALLVLVAALAAAAVAAVRRMRRRGAADVSARDEAVVAQPTAAAPPDKRASLHALQEACRANAAAAAAQALLRLARAQWPDDPPRGLSALAARLDTGAAEIIALDRCLYGTHALDWKGDALWEQLKAGLRAAKPGASQERHAWDELYRDGRVPH